jgi:hypothetical protein
MTMTFRSTITNDQRAFDAVCHHLAKQQRRARTRLTDASRNPGAFACEYFSSSTGYRCAIGALLTLPSAQYAEEHYGGEGISILAEYMPQLIDLPDLDIDLLQQLQQAHDESDTLRELRTTLSEIAEAWQLNPAAITLIQKWEGSTDV